MAYPEDVDCCVPLSEDRSTYRRRFVENSARLFLLGPPSLEVISRLFDNKEAKFEKVDSLDSLLRLLAGREQQIFYLIPQQHSWGRFRISQEDLERILSSHQVFAPFLNVLGGFGSKVKEDDYLDPCYQDYVCGTSDTERRFASYEICYKISFFERNHRNRGDPWSLRQTGVFQRFSSSTSKTAWILLQLSQRARHVLEDKLKTTNVLKQHPLLLHIGILSSLATDWKAYLQHLHALLSDLDEKVAFSKVPRRRVHDYDVSFADCQQLHLLERKILRAALVLDQCLQVSAHLEECCLKLEQYCSQQQTDELLREVKNYSGRIKTCKMNTDSLLQRSRGTAVLLSKILEARNEAVLQDINQMMHANISLIERSASNTLRENSTLTEIARQGRNDSAKLQALTMIATLYLPATLVATVFSSSLVQWKNIKDPTGHERSHFVVVSDFWIFVICTIALMILTFFGARLKERGWSCRIFGV